MLYKVNMRTAIFLSVQIVEENHSDILYYTPYNFNFLVYQENVVSCITPYPSNFL